MRNTYHQMSSARLHELLQQKYRRIQRLEAKKPMLSNDVNEVAKLKRQRAFIAAVLASRVLQQGLGI